MKVEEYTFYKDDYLYCKLDFFRKRVFLHLQIYKRLTGMKIAKDRWPKLKQMLKNLGYKKMNVVIPDGDAKLYKFEQHFGFVEKKRVKGLILMEQEI